MVVLLGSISELHPSFDTGGKLKPLLMNLVIQMMMLIAGAVISIGCKVKSSGIANGPVFKAGMVAIFSVFGVDERYVLSGAFGGIENCITRRGSEPSVGLCAGTFYSVKAG